MPTYPSTFGKNQSWYLTVYPKKPKSTHKMLNGASIYIEVSENNFINWKNTKIMSILKFSPKSSQWTDNKIPPHIKIANKIISKINTWAVEPTRDCKTWNTFKTLSITMGVSNSGYLINQISKNPLTKWNIKHNKSSPGKRWPFPRCYNRMFFLEFI